MIRFWSGILKALLSFVLVFCLVPQKAFADDDSSSSYAPAEGFIHVIEIFSWYPDFEASLDLSSYGSPVDAQTAEDTVRDLMIERSEAIKVAVSVDSVDDPSGFVESLMQGVLEETEDPRAGDYLRYNLKYWKSSVAYYSGGTTYWIALTLTYNTTSAQEQQVDVKVEEILDSLNVDSMTDYEKVKAIHDWICLNVEYDYAHSSDSTYRPKYTTYGAICNGSAVCQGYATAFYRLCREAGVDTRVIPGTGNLSGETISHAWDIVKLGCCYYNVDPTWDENLSTDGVCYTYFLKSDNCFAGHTRDSEYSTNQFHSAYPMATSSYSEGSNGAPSACSNFTDTPADAWYVKNGALDYVLSNGIMTGTSPTTFSPNSAATRAQVATILYRLEGSPPVDYDTVVNFPDVKEGSWCYEAIMWARSEGIVNGLGNGTFGPNNPVTREELAKMLYGYALHENVDVSCSTTLAESMADWGSVSKWAQSSMAWAVDVGIITGTKSGGSVLLNPQDTATRAQLATMIMRFDTEVIAG